MEIPSGSASRSPTWRSRAARTVGSPSATSTPTSSEERPSARRVWEYSGRPRTHRRADEEGTPASAPLRGALPTVGLPVLPRLGVKTTWRVDSHFSPPAIHTGPTAYPQRRQRLTLPRAGRSAPHGRHRPRRERPPRPRAYYGRGALRVFTRWPPPFRGSLPVQRSLAGRLSDTIERGGSGLRLSALAGQVGRLGTRRGPGGAKRQPRLSSRASIGDPVEIQLADHALMGLARMPTGGWSPAPRGPDGAS